MRSFWPISEAAQADYEALREAALGGLALIGVAAGRFQRAGLAGLVVRPAAGPVFTASLSGALRPPWTPYVDPRTEALAAGYALLLCANEPRDRQAAQLNQAVLIACRGGER